MSLLTAFSARRIAGSYPDSPQYQADAGKFHNPVPQPRDGVGKMLGIIWNMLWHKPRDATPQHPPLPLQPLTRADLLAAPDRSLFRLGHSTVLLKLRGQFWLTDPVFSERASPLQWMGPKRFHAPPIRIEDLPPLQAVILSHDHYDHLDQDAIMQLAGKTRQFVTPLGVGDRLAEWGVPRTQIRQLDWWQQVDIEGLRLVATPAQHFSGRTPFDGNQTLWASWAIIDDDFKIFFSGDSGYFDGFKTIGEKLGPFDLTLMETGAYDPQWPYVHMQPAQTLQAHLDLRGKWLLPVHNGTFDLALHDWYDPFEKIAALARQNEVLLATPEMGERLDMQQPQATRPWWRYADDVAVAEPGLAGTTQPSR